MEIGSVYMGELFDEHPVNWQYLNQKIGYKYRDGDLWRHAYKYECWHSRMPDIKSSNLRYVAALFDVRLSSLYTIANNPSLFYRTYNVPKHRGSGTRRIDEPDEILKRVQRWILDEILYCIPCSKYAKGYVRGVTVKDNARFHRNQKIVLTMDVKDFFPSISENQVFHIFDQSCDYERSVAVLLTKLCTYDGVLPQGAPTSAYLSNLVMREFDEAVGAYCQALHIRFTRYADDMTFSGDFDIAALIYFVDQQLARVGLQRHPEKLKIMRQHDRQKTTGIVVNAFQQVPREYRMKIRQEVHYIKKYGLDSHAAHIGVEKLHYLQSLLGRINYVLSVNPKDSKMVEYRKYIEVLDSIEILQLEKTRMEDSCKHKRN